MNLADADLENFARNGDTPSERWMAAELLMFRRMRPAMHAREMAGRCNDARRLLEDVEDLLGRLEGPEAFALRARVGEWLGE